MPRVSVIIPAFNAETLLGDTLQSVLQGSFQDFEIIVIDDGSKDQTAAVAASHGPKVRVIRQANQGMSASRNNGIRAADSEFWALLDADDIWHPRKLELQVALMDSQPATGLAYTEFFSWDGLAPPQFGEADLQLDEHNSGWMYHRMLLTNFVLPSSAMFRRASAQATGEFPTLDQQTDDWEYTVCASRQYPFAKLAAPLVAYRQSPGSLSKRPRDRNVTELMRDSLIRRFGLVSPQGQPVDKIELQRRRYRGHRDFADMHLARGDWRLGLKCFARLLADGPQRAKSLEAVAKASLARLRSLAG